MSARPPHAGYLLAKLVARHRLASAAVVLGAAGLTIGLAASVRQGRQAAAARDQAQARLTQIHDITHDVVLRFGDALTYLPGGLAVKEDLLKGLIGNLDRMATEMGDDPEWQADLTAGAAAGGGAVAGAGGQTAGRRSAGRRPSAPHAGLDELAAGQGAVGPGRSRRGQRVGMAPGGRSGDAGAAGQGGRRDAQPR